MRGSLVVWTTPRNDEPPARTPNRPDRNRAWAVCRVVYTARNTAVPASESLMHGTAGPPLPTLRSEPLRVQQVLVGDVVHELELGGRAGGLLGRKDQAPATRQRLEVS